MIERKPVVFVMAMLLCCSFMQGCASIQPPPGGPEDKTPPKLLETTPKERETKVPRDIRLDFRFQDPLDKNSFLTAFSITPYIDGKIKYSWSGYNEVEVRLPEQLRENTTYTVSLARDLKTRRGNALQTPLHLTFSTGTTIDTGKLDGFLLPAIGSNDPLKSNEIFLFAYDLLRHRADTLNYTHTRPDLMTQADDKGAFEFLAMKPAATYRVFAVQDVFRTHLYDPGVDTYGMPIGDAVLDSAVRSDFRIRMAAQVDTVKPELEDAEAIDAYHLRVKFSKPVDTLSVASRNFILTQVSDKKQLPIVSAYRDRPDKHGNELVLITSSHLQENIEYQLNGVRDSIHDEVHNRLSDSMNSAQFTPSAVQDTFVAPRIENISIYDSVRGVSVMPRIQLVWTDGVKRMALDSSIQLSDSASKPTQINVQWIDDSRIIIEPKDTLLPREFYTLKLQTTRFRSPIDSAARQAKDTTIVIRFQTEDYRDDGKLSGDVQIADSIWAKYKNAQVIVQLLDLNGLLQQERHLATHTSHYEFERVPQGSYRVRGYIAQNGTALFDAGSLIPFRFAAPSGDYSSAIDIRPRWSTERVDFPLK